MENKSIWIEDNAILKNKEQKISNETDILIIGGGITGLTTAYLMKNSNYKITLIDKSKIGMGVTSKTTAKINYLQGIIYQKLAKNFGVETSKLYYESQIEAIDIIKKIIKRNNISCDFEKVDSIVFTLENSGVSKIYDEKKILESFNINVDIVNNEDIKIGIRVKDTYVFNPLKYLNKIVEFVKEKVNIYENVIARNIIKENDGFIIETNKGNIKAKKVVIACHYPFFIIPTLVPLKTYIKREYVNASKIENPKKITAINIDNTFHSIRYYKNYLIYGSNNHKLTNKIDYKKKYQKSQKDFFEYFNKRPEYSWMNQDIISHDNLPLIGEIKNHLYIATAFNTWGMTNGTIAAKIISDLILNNNNNKYVKLFDPKRKNMNLVVNSILGSFNYLNAYVQAIIVKNNPYYIKIKGINYGIYTDNQNKMHVIKLICPHMKCGLVFNREESTWDCPCHGSRFDLDGNLLEGPATSNLESKNK